MNTIDATLVRLQLLANGYLPTPNLDKRCVLKGWASQNFVDNLSPETVQAWKKDHRGFKATGILVRNGLMPIDLDIRDEAVIDLVLDALQEIAPGLLDQNAPWRVGKPPKMMILARWQVSTAYLDPFVRIASDKFVDEAGANHQVEIFGGALTRTGHTSKQIGAFGPHSYEEDEAGKVNFRKVLHEYDYGDGASPLTVPLAELPAMTQEQAWALLKRFEEIATERGWRRQVAATQQAGQFAYDITAATRFDVEGGPDQVSYTELCAMDENGLRVSGSFIDGSSHRRDKCRVSWCNKAQAVGVWDTESGSWHLPVEAKPPGVEDQAEALREGLAKLQAARVPTTAKTMPAKPKDTAGLTEQVDWLLQTQAYCPLNHTMVDLFATSEACELKPQAFQHQYIAWRHESVGPRGGKIVDLASNAWLINTARHTVRGVRMRPDRDFPLYQEDGHFFKNTYCKPLHPPGGDLVPFLTFLERFLPDTREREWLLDWMAHKQRRPEVPGTAVVFVADDVEDVNNGKFGTGRGMMFRAATKLFGADYTRAQSFGIVSGTSSQGTYNDWLQGSVLVMVDEAKSATATSHRRGERNSVYEVLKDTVDPAPKRIRVNPKGRQAYDGVSYASFWIATNHRNAMAIPRDDRRFTVLRNGRPMAQAERNAMEAWLVDDASAGALAAFLMTRDLAGFDMFMPLLTSGKADMAEMALSDVDELMEELKADKARGLVFTKAQMEITIDRLLNRGSNHWRGEFAAAWPAYCTGVKTVDGGWRRVRDHGTQVKLYCFRENLAQARNAPPAALTREAAKWGGEIPLQGLAEVKGLTEKDE